MDTEFRQYRILLINRSPYALAELVGHLTAEVRFEFVSQAVNDIGFMWPDLQKNVWDLILYCGVPDSSMATMVDLVRSGQMPAPVMILAENPAVDETVDWMRAGIAAVVDRQNSARVLDLIHELVQGQGAVAGQDLAGSDHGAGSPDDGDDQVLKQTYDTRGDQLNTLLNTMQDALMSISLPDRRVIVVSQAFPQVFGYPHEAFLEDPNFFRKVVHPDDLQLALDAMQTCLARGFVEFDHRIIWPDGEIRWVHRRAWVNYDEDGQPIQINDSSRDITQRKATEKALHVFKNVISSTTDGISVVNREYCYEMVNYAYLERTGRRREEIEGRHVADVMGEDVFQELLKPELDRCMAGETIGFSDWFVYTGLGRRFVSVTYSPYRDASNAIAGVVVNTRDITELKEVEGELRASEERLKSLIESQTNFLIRTDLEGRYTYWNPKYEREFGWLYELQELAGSFSFDSVYAYHHQRLEETVQKCLAEPGKAFQVELDKPARDGGSLATLWEFICLTDAGGAPVGLQGVGVDITDQKEALSVVQYQADLLQQVSDAIIATDKEMMITAWNKAATEIYGWTEDEAIGQPIDELLNTEWVDESQASAQATIAQVGQWRGEIRQSSKTGAQRDIVAAVSLLSDHQGQLMGGVTVNRDITTQKRRSRLEARISNVLEAVAEGQSLVVILEELVHAIEEFEPDIRASVLLLDQQTGQLRHGAAPTLPESYNAAIDGVRIGPAAGSCGTAAFENRLVIVRDISTDPLWRDYRELAMAHGLRACWSQPVTGHDDTVLGTVALYYEEMRTPTANELDLIRLVARIAGLAIERIQAEANLRESEEQYRSLVESADAVIAVFDDAGAIQFANELAATPIGMSPEALLGQDMRAIFPPEVAERQLRVIREVIYSGQGLVEEAPTSVAGQERWFRTSIQPIRNAAGDIHSALIFANDITQFKQAEVSLRQSEQRFQLFMRYLPGAVFIKDRAERTVYCNERYAALGGTVPDEIVGKRSHEYMDGELAAAFTRENELVFQEGRAMEFDHTFPGPDEHSHWLTIKFPIPHEGQEQLLGAISLDVTGERRAQEALKRSENRYRQMFELVQLPKLITDPKTAQILDANPAAVAFYGYPLETLKTMTMMQINMAEPDEILGKMQQVLTGELASCPFQQRLADGTIRDVEGFAAAMELSGRQVLYCTYIDITDRNRAQAALTRANQELEQRVRERTTELRQAKDRIEAVFNHSGDGILLLDAEQRIERGNRTFAQMFAIGQDTCSGKALPAFVAPEERPALETTLKELILAQETQRLEIRAMRTDGTLFDTEMSVAPIRQNDGVVENIVCIVRDISDRKRAEAERQQYLAEIEDLYNNAPAGYHSLDEAGVFTQINDTELAWLGYTREEVIGKLHFSTLLTDESRAVFQEKFGLLRQYGQVTDIEFALKRKDGTTIWVLGSASVVRDEDDRFVRSRVTLYNITELKQAQQAIAEERNLLRTVIDAVPDFIYVKNRNNRVILNNTAHADFLGGLVTEEATGKSYLEALPAGMRTKVLAEEAKIFATGQALENIEDRLTRANGEPLWTVTTKVPLRNLHQEVVGLVGITHDITRIKANEEALRLSEQRLRESENMLQMVLDTIPVRVFWKDTDSVYLGCNRLFARDAGLDQTSDIVGKRDADLPWLPEQARAYREDDAYVIESGEAKLEYEESLTGRDGQVIFLQTNKLALRNLENEIIGVLGTFVDITTRKRAEETLKLALKKERELGELKSHFVSMASHQFRTPLAAILANTETLSIYRDQMDETQIDIRLGRIRKQVIYMKDIMEDVLELARLQTDQIKHQPIMGDLDALCREVIEEFQHQVKYQDRIIYTCPDEVILLKFDPHSMHHLLRNLIHNALKYSGNEFVQIRLVRASCEVALAVQDQGIGIPADDLNSLFEPFYRARNVGDISGTGLGLSIAKQVVDAHRGKIHVESTLNVGTTFAILLPIQTTKDAEHGQDIGD